MRYTRKPILPTEVEAVQLKTRIRIGEDIGLPGDYLVTEGDKQYIVDKKAFEATFRPKGDVSIPFVQPDWTKPASPWVQPIIKPLETPPWTTPRSQPPSITYCGDTGDLPTDEFGIYWVV